MCDMFLASGKLAEHETILARSEAGRDEAIAMRKSSPSSGERTNSSHQGHRRPVRGRGSGGPVQELRQPHLRRHRPRAKKFQERRLDAKGRKWVYLRLDATYVDAHVEKRVGGRVARRVEKRAIVVAIGVDGRGRRDILGLAVGKSESREFRGDFLLSLKRRGLGDPKLAATDGNAALRAAAREILPRTDLQLCRVHWMREILGRIPNKRKREAADMLKAIFAQETPEAILAEWNRATAELRRISKAPGIVRATADDKRDALPVYARYPKERWTRISATNIVERQNQEIKRRSRLASIFPNDESIERLIGARMIGTEAKWAMEGPYMLPDKIEAVMNGSAIGPFPIPEEVREAA